MFRDIYAAELEYLYGLAHELGIEQSRIAPMLGRDADAGVSRLAQTVAFLSARLRQRLDDELPEVIHPVLESLCPWLLQPLPSSTIVELLPAPAMKEPQVVRAGSVFSGRPVNGPPCVFRSTTDVHVRPWSLQGVELANERTEIRLQLVLRADAVLGRLAGPLRLFFSMPLAAALELRARILRSTVSACGRVTGGAAEVTLASRAEPIVAAPHAQPPENGDALRALRSYFASPEQFAFVDIPNLERVGALGASVRTFEIVLRLAAPLAKSIPVDPDAMRLHCVPAVNVHPLPTVNAPLVRGRCSIDLREQRLYAIEQVTLVYDDLSTRTALPYSQFSPPPIDSDGRLPLLYRTERVPSVSAADLDVALIFVDLKGSDTAVGASSVDLKLLATDGDRAQRIGVGELCVPTPASPPLLAFRNVTPISRAATPALDGEHLWAWFALLKTPFWQLVEHESLARVLALANVAAWARWPESKPGEEVFEGLLSLCATRLTGPGRDEVFPGAGVDVRVREALFSGAGDIDLFGERLAALFASALREHEWFELVLHDEHGTLLCEYPRRFGTRREL